jgi:hypothetical protein
MMGLGGAHEAVDLVGAGLDGSLGLDARRPKGK